MAAGDPVHIHLSDDELRIQQAKLVEATELMAAIMRRYDMTGLILLAVPGLGNSRLIADNSISVLNIGPNDDSMLVTEPAPDDPNRSYRIAASANMMHMISDMCKGNAQALDQIGRFMAEEYDLTHTQGVHVPPPTEH